MRPSLLGLRLCGECRRGEACPRPPISPPNLVGATAYPRPSAHIPAPCFPHRLQHSPPMTQTRPLFTPCLLTHSMLYLTHGKHSHHHPSPISQPTPTVQHPLSQMSPISPYFHHPSSPISQTSQTSPTLLPPLSVIPLRSTYWRLSPVSPVATLPILWYNSRANVYHTASKAGFL